MLACCYGHYDIGAGKKINKDMWTGSWIVVQTSFRPTSSCLARASCARMCLEGYWTRDNSRDNMAAAVEGSDRKVRALLSSFLHTSGKEDESR